MPRIVKSPQADEDLAQIWDYIARDNPAAADNLLREFDAQLRRHAESPLMGRAREELATGLRSFAVGRYVLFYSPIESGIALIHVLHGSRDLRRLFGRK